MKKIIIKIYFGLIFVMQINCKRGDDEPNSFFVFWALTFV